MNRLWVEHCDVSHKTLLNPAPSFDMEGSGWLSRDLMNSFFKTQPLALTYDVS